MNQYFSVLPNLPPVPQHLIDEMLSVIASGQGGADNGEASVTGYSPAHVYAGDVCKSTTRPYKYALTDNLLLWITSNVLPNPCSVGFHIMPPTASDMVPHTDRTRDYALIYTIDPGGPDVRTTVYQEIGYPIRRPKRLSHKVEHFDQLDYLDHVVLQPGTWAILDTEVIHGVSNIESDRIAIHLGISSDKLLADTITAYFG